MRSPFDHYENLLDIEKIMDCFHTIRLNTKHKDKIFVFELFFSCNVFTIYETLQKRVYHHQQYFVFLLNRPKYRIIMSESMTDKIVNHLVSKYVLFPLLEPKLIPMNVATRAGLGTERGIDYIKRYVHTLKMKHEKFYVLKCDISKYFYSIDHTILFEKLKKIIHDEEILQLLKEIINSTNHPNINQQIKIIIDKEKWRLKEKKYEFTKSYSRTRKIAILSNE